MSADVSSLHAQVESVLGALVKAATVELTRLFESKYRGSAAVAVDVEKLGEKTRSVGVQVDGPPIHLDGCVEEHIKEEEHIGVCPIPAEILLAEDNGHADSWGALLKEQVSAEAEDLVELGIFETESLTDSDVKTDVIFQVCADPSTPTSSTREMPFIIVTDSTNDTSGETVKFVCPLIVRPESPVPKLDGVKTCVEAEPVQACVSTAKGTAYRPSLSDGAMTPVQGGIWEQIQAQEETKNSLHVKLKLTSHDPKLLSQCAVELVDVLTVPDSGTRPQIDIGKQKNSPRLPKDLRQHQGIHTGHRICCFTPCKNGVWRLRKVVAHSRDGYTCAICKKPFKHRKILRRHERFHTGEKPYQCSQCPKTFALRKSLRRHERFHTGERPHVCTKCNKSFHLRENLKAHLRFHSGEKPYSCTMCGKLFRIKRNLEKHSLSQCGFFVPSFKMIAGM